MFAYCLEAYLRFVIQRLSFLLRLICTLQFSAGLFPAAFRKIVIAFFNFLGSFCDLRALSYGFQRFCFLLSKQEDSYIQCLPNV